LASSQIPVRFLFAKAAKKSDSGATPVGREAKAQEGMISALAILLAVFKQRHCRPRLRPADRVFWVFLRQAWRNWANALIVVEPDTVVSW